MWGSFKHEGGAPPAHLGSPYNECLVAPANTLAVNKHMWKS